MSRYSEIPVKRHNSQPVRSTSIYKIFEESSEDYYVISTEGDRFDTLASEYYRDSSLWYIIAAANPTVRRDTMYITPGYQIRIPLPLSKVLTVIERENKTR